MNKRHLLMTILAAAAFLAGGELRPSKASAQDVLVTGPLAGAPAVRHMRQYRRNRLQLTPFAAFTLQDPYRRTILAGANVGYHFLDWLGISALYAYGVAGLDTNLTDEIVDQGVTTDRNRLSLPSRTNFDKQIGEIDWMAAAQVNFVPLRGKLAIFQKGFLDADFTIFGGIALVGVTERANTNVATLDSAADVNQAYLDSQLARDSRLAWAATFGANLNMYFTDWIGLSIEWRGLPFEWNASGTDESGSPEGDYPDGVINYEDRLFQFNHMVNIGLVFYIPGQARITE